MRSVCKYNGENVNIYFNWPYNVAAVAADDFDAFEYQTEVEINEYSLFETFIFSPAREKKNKTVKPQ